MSPEKDVFADAQLRNEHEFLVNDVDAEIVSLVRGLDLDWLALPGQLPAIRLISPRDYLHERRLTGAVFANQCVYFARTHLEGYVVEHGDAAEGLCDVLHPEERFMIPSRQRDASLDRRDFDFPVVSFTPGFSQGLRGKRTPKPFKRFPVRGRLTHLAKARCE